MITTEQTLSEIVGESSTPAGTGSNDATDQNRDATATSTVDDGSSSEGTLNADDQGAGDKDEAAVKEGGEEGKGKDATAGQDDEGKDVPFHEHPRWRQILKERDEAIERAAKAEGKAEALAEMQGKGKGNAEAGGDDGSDKGYVDITTISEDEITEWQARDPKGYAANMLAQAKAEVSRELMSEDAKKQAEAEQNRAKEETRKTYETYAEKNPDFKEMWEKGEIQEYMRKHPGHTAMSAHMEMTESVRIERAVKAKEKEIERNLLAKKRAGGGLGSGGGGPRGGSNAPEDPAMQDTKSSGGLISAIANNLRRMRNST